MTNEVKTNRYDDLVCPCCRRALDAGDGKLLCASCSREYRIRSGIPSFAEGTSRWRLSPKGATPKTVIERARIDGWRQSLSLIDRARSDWILGEDRFPLAVMASPKGRVLDCGAGWGGLTFWLAKEFAQVYAIDAQLDGLEFIDVRAEQEGIRHVTTVRGNLLTLPFPDDFFDVVVLNGVLEWVGTFDDKRAPEELQKDALREMARVLKPSGTLFLAIENRFGLQYFLGYKEDHTGLRFISLLPRAVARLYHRIRRGKDFRALTHSRPALGRMLRRAGFVNAKWFFCYPSYRNTRYASSLDGVSGLRFLLRHYLTGERRRGVWRRTLSKAARRVTRTLSNFPSLVRVTSFFSPAWIVFASRREPPLLALRSRDGPTELAGSAEDLVVAINPRRANLLSLNHRSEEITGKTGVALNETAAHKSQLAFLATRLLRCLDEGLEDHLPVITLHDGATGVIDRVDAVDGRSINLNDAAELTALQRLLVRLARVQVPEEEIRGAMSASDLRRSFSGAAADWSHDAAFLALLEQAQILHGDLNRKNVYVVEDRPVATDAAAGRIVLLDFEHVRIGPAVLNWYDFLLRNLVLGEGRFPLAHETVVHRFDRLPGRPASSALWSRLTRSFLEELHIPVSHHRLLCRIYVRHLCSDPIFEDAEKAMRALADLPLSLGE